MNANTDKLDMRLPPELKRKLGENGDAGEAARQILEQHYREREEVSPIVKRVREAAKIIRELR